MKNKEQQARRNLDYLLRQGVNPYRHRRAKKWLRAWNKAESKAIAKGLNPFLQNKA